MRPRQPTQAVRGGIGLTLAILTLTALTGCDAAPESPRTSAAPTTEASRPAGTSSPARNRDHGGAPEVKRSPEEIVLLQALDRAGLTQVGVPEHGGPGDAWAAGQLGSGHTGVLHSNRDRIMTPGKVVDRLRVDGIPAEIRDTAAFGPVVVLDCRDFALGVATLDGFTPTGDRAEALDLARTVLSHLPC